jgi:hypothetical protein
MKSFHILIHALGRQSGSPVTGLRHWGEKSGSPVTGLCHWGVKSVFAAVVLAVCLGAVCTAQAQVVPAADAGGARLSVGGTASGYYLGYGELKIFGASAFVDADTLRRFGVEGEARWLVFHLKADQVGPHADEHASTYLAGPRYHLNIGRFHPYVKTLVGLGQFNYPYNYGQDNDLVVAPGGGLDFRLNRRISLRAADIEYQIWPQFHYGQMSSFGVSSGIRVRIF